VNAFFFRFTARPEEGIAYAIALDWPAESELQLEVVDHSQVTGVTLLGSESEGTLQWEPANPGIRVTFPNPLNNKSQWAWTLKILTEQ